MVQLGEPSDIGERYLEINFGRDRDTGVAVPTDDEWKGDARALSVWIEDDAGERRSAVAQARQVTINVLIAWGVDVEDARVSIFLHNEDQKVVLVLSSVLDIDHARFSAGERAQFSFSFHNVLAPGRYSPVVNLADGGSPLEVADSYSSDFSFVVTGTRALGGLVDVPTEVAVTRADRVIARDPLP